LDQALPIAERIRYSIEHAGFRDITVSIGVTEFQPEFDVEAFVKSADDALYTAKQMGRNRIRTFNS
jgi:diguanylate cyclase (GGDEF)-like protein